MYIYVYINKCGPLENYTESTESGSHALSELCLCSALCERQYVHVCNHGIYMSTCMIIYICMHAFIYIYIYIYTYTFIYIYIYIYICTPCRHPASCRPPSCPPSLLAAWLAAQVPARQPGRQPGHLADCQSTQPPAQPPGRPTARLRVWYRHGLGRAHGPGDPHSQLGVSG